MRQITTAKSYGFRSASPASSLRLLAIPVAAGGFRQDVVHGLGRPICSLVMVGPDPRLSGLDFRGGSCAANGLLGSAYQVPAQAGTHFSAAWAVGNVGPCLRRNPKKMLNVS